MINPRLLLVCCAPLVCRAGEPPSLSSGKETGKETPAAAAASRWSYGASFQTMQGIQVRFSGLGGLANPGVLPPPGGGRDYNYDDGFVRVDSSGNFDDRTWNWGYDSSSQFNPANGGIVTFSRSSGLADASDSESGESASGIQFSAIYDGGPLPSSFPVPGDGVKWGARFSLNLLGGDVRSNGDLQASISRLEDTYALNGVVPPQSPWQDGSFQGPGPRISDTPTRAAAPVIIPGGSTVAGFREVDLFLASADAGVFFTVPITAKLSAGLETGFTLAVASADYDFLSITSMPGLPAQTTRGAGDDTSLLPGFYVGGNLDYRLNDRWSLHTALRYQYLRSLSVQSGASSAELDFHSAFTAIVGLEFKF